MTTALNLESQATMIAVKPRPSAVLTEMVCDAPLTAMKPDRPQIYYIWGHAYEFDIHGDWERFEQFCQLISGKSDIFYGTNRQVLLNED